MAAAPVSVEPRNHRKTAQGKAWIRRLGKDHSQSIRRSVQILFLLLNLWIGVEFVQFVHQYEGAGGGPVSGLTRPAGVEGWLPIAGMMNTRYFVLTGELPRIHPATLFLFVSFLTMSLLLRKAFCGWLCPVGTLSEYLWKVGRATFRRNFALPRWLDIGLRSLKYLLFGLFGYAVFSMPAVAIREFLESPYGIVADVKMLNFFRYMGVGAAVTIGVLMIVSIFVQNFWCRYLCPYGAMMGLASLLSPLRIRRSPDACIDCAKCAKACPSQLPVDQLIQIRSAECLGCLECVTVCPAENALEMTAMGRRKMPAWAMAAGVAIVFCGLVGVAKLTGHWDSPISDLMYREFIPRAAEFSHP